MTPGLQQGMTVTGNRVRHFGNHPKGKERRSTEWRVSGALNELFAPVRDRLRPRRAAVG